MCDPVSLGVGTAVVGGGKALASHKAQTDQTYAANKARLDQYNAEVAQREIEWNSRIGAYGQKISEYDQSGFRARDALARGYEQAQTQLNEVYKSAAFQTQAQNIATNQAIGRTEARGQSGRSAMLSAQNSLAAYGRNQAILEESILGARNRFAYDTEGLRQQYQSNRANAYSQVAVQPLQGAAPVEPTFSEGPSALGLVADLGGAALSGFSTYNSLKAPSVGNIPTEPISMPTDTGGWTLPDASTPIFRAP